jgi:signal transduction histidine kinase
MLNRFFKKKTSLNGEKSKPFIKNKNYHFEWKHLLVLFTILFVLQITISFMQKISIENLQKETQDWYRRDTVEEIATMTVTSFELLLEVRNTLGVLEDDFRKNLIRAFNLILSQHLLQQNIEEIYIVATENDKVVAIKDGITLYSYLYTGDPVGYIEPGVWEDGVEIYKQFQAEIREKEQVFTIAQNQVFHVLVPLVPFGEYTGAVYIKLSPDFSFISRQVVSSYDQSALIFSALILFGLLAMFYISSFSLKERDETQKLLYNEREKRVRTELDHQKESMFTKRIYHTHHKAEKIMGFIKGDLNSINQDDNQVNQRIIKYANFISRVIYDMKWYDPPLQTIRGPMFSTNINEVIEFLINNIFLRISRQVGRINFSLNLQKDLPNVEINEYVIWEVLEPIIQNSIDHSGEKNIQISIISKIDKDKNRITVYIQDNGNGINPDLLVADSNGKKKIFQENISTKDDVNSGYGCYLAYEISKKCGWNLDVNNVESGGCKFEIHIPA